MKNHVAKAVEQLAKYGGLKSLGNIFASRKGVFAILAVVASYFMLLGRLPEGEDPEIVNNMAEIFGMVVATVSAMFIGGTALEDGLKKRATGEAKPDEEESSSASDSK